MNKKESVEEIKFKITHSKDEKTGIPLARCTVIDNGHIVYDTTMPLRYFLHDNTMASKFYRWMFELDKDSSYCAKIRKRRYNAFCQRWIGRFEVLKLRIQKFYLQTRVYFLKQYLNAIKFKQFKQTCNEFEQKYAKSPKKHPDRH